MSTYLDRFENSLVSGIGLISTMSANTLTPWRHLSAEQVSALERSYGIRSGNKVISRLPSRLTDSDIANMVVSYYHSKWQKLWDDYNIEYHPLDAYIMEESGSSRLDVSESSSITFGKKVTESATDTGTVQNNSTENYDDINNIYGFNSVTASPANDSEENSEVQSTETRNLQASSNVTNSGMDSNVHNSGEDKEYEYSKRGNIGYNTPQKMLMEEFELWKNTFFSIVFQDIDDMIMLSVY